MKKCAVTRLNANKFHLPLAAGGVQTVNHWRDLDWTLAADDAAAYQAEELHDLIFTEMQTIQKLGQGMKYMLSDSDLNTTNIC
jgi:hypothetical protein